eukprot:Filipodium_phascolosomae@DN3942_c0_g1_i1.p1
MSGEWVHGMCDCCQNPLYCLFSLWCPWCSAGNIAMKSDATCCPVHCCFAGLCLTPNVRRMYDIDGSACCDCIKHLCCTACSLTRMRDQLDIPRTAYKSAPGQVEMQ